MIGPRGAGRQSAAMPHNFEGDRLPGLRFERQSMLPGFNASKRPQGDVPWPRATTVPDPDRRCPSVGTRNRGDAMREPLTALEDRCLRYEAILTRSGLEEVAELTAEMVRAASPTVPGPAPRSSPAPSRTAGSTRTATSTADAASRVS